MSDLKVSGRTSGDTSARRGTKEARRLLTLYEASRLSNLAIHELKRAICEGRLRAAWQGRYYVCRADLDEFLHGL